MQQNKGSDTTRLNSSALEYNGGVATPIRATGSRAHALDQPQHFFGVYKFLKAGAMHIKRRLTIHHSFSVKVAGLLTE